MAIAETTLVVGGTGKTGRRVAEKLAARGRPVRLGSRAATPPFDWEDRATWAPALRGCAAAYIAYVPDVALPGSADVVRAFAETALREGVNRLVLLSGRGEEEAERAEDLLRESGAAWTILRCAWFNQNFSENFLLEPILAGEVVLPASAGAVGEPFVDADDIADAAVAALTEDGHVGKLYELTGPRLLTFPEAIAEIAAASGREIRYAQVSHAEYAAMLRGVGLPEAYVWLIDYLFATVLDGRNASVADGVRQALGRPPRDFADYARRTAASGVWNAPVGAPA